MEPARAEALRTRIKAVELEAERLQQEALYGLAQTSRLGRPSPSKTEAAQDSISSYQGVIGPFPPGPLDTCFRHLQSSTRRVAIAANERDRPMTSKTPRRLVIGISGASGPFTACECWKC